MYLDEGAVEVDALDCQELGEGLRLTLLHLHHTKDTCKKSAMSFPLDDLIRPGRGAWQSLIVHGSIWSK